MSKSHKLNFLTAIMVFCAMTPASKVSAIDADLIIKGTAAGSQLGRSVSVVSDMDSDSFPDLLIGATGNAKVYVISSATLDTLLIVNSTLTRSAFALSVTSAGDVNNDGIPDILVGSGGTSSVWACWEAPTATVHSGATGAELYRFMGWPACKQFPLATFGIGDYDSDGFDDVLVGFSRSYFIITVHGIAYIFSGRTGDTLAIMMGEDSINVASAFGKSVADAGDYNADGFRDIIIGAPDNSAGGLIAGRAYVFSGENLDTLAVFTGAIEVGGLGDQVHGGGDINNDGFSDVLVADVGKVFVYSGKDNSILYTFEIVGVPENVGDVNGDGYADIMISQGRGRGRVFVYSGKDGSLYSVLYGENDDDWFGSSSEGLGDINGDGFDDYIVGAPFNDAGGNDAGRAYVFYGGRPRYLCGDVNMDNQVDTTDVTYLIDYYFHAGPPPQPFDAGNVNCSAGIDISDIIYLMMKLDNQIPNVCCPNTVSPPDRWIQYYDKPSKG
jgi:FG-GAP repeat/FG-GAP-like repeat